MTPLTLFRITKLFVLGLMNSRLCSIAQAWQQNQHMRQRYSAQEFERVIGTGSCT